MKVVIYDHKIIPSLGQGPFLTPIEISEDKFRNLRRMGFQVKDVDEIAIENELAAMKAEKEAQKEEETVKEETHEVIEEEETVEEETSNTEELEDEETSDTNDDEDEETSEVVEEEEDEEKTYTREDLEAMYMSDLKLLAKELNLEFKNNIRKAELIDLILGE